jgi:inhibitor of KinA
VTPEPRFRWASDHGVLVSFGDEPSEAVRERVLAAAEAIAGAGVAGLRNLHPAYTSVLAVCDPLAASPEAFEDGVRRAVAGAPARSSLERRLVEVPVCYDPDLGPDLEEVARLHGLTPAEAARLHASADYVVAFLGFTPGFPYLDGLPRKLATPRLAAPRMRVPAGSVAIGGGQTGIYPFTTPGGWRLIGRTTLSLFRADREPPSLLRPGDRVKFVPVPREELAERAT